MTSEETEAQLAVISREVDQIASEVAEHGAKIAEVKATFERVTPILIEGSKALDEFCETIRRINKEIYETIGIYGYAIQDDGAVYNAKTGEIAE